MTTFVLLRHGQTDWNAQHLYQGNSDIPLNETGIQQAKDAKELMSRYKYDAVYCSDLCRARQTAKLALEGTYPYEKIQLDARLRERNFGTYEGGCYDEDQLPEEYRAAKLADPENFKFPEGESLLDVADRVTPVYHELLNRHPDQTIGIVAHGSLLSILIMVMCGEPILDRTRLHLSNAEPYIITIDRDGTVLSKSR